MRTVPYLIAGWGRRTPEAVAVVDGPRTLTYRQLVERASRVAAAVRRAGADPDEVVGLACARGLDGLVGMLGILLAGCAYLYLDPTWPVDRLRHMVRECRLPLVLTGTSTVDVGVPELSTVEAAAVPATMGRIRVYPRDLCYVVYTSGSTGTPKGVAVEHSGAENMARQLAREFDVRAGTRMLQFASWAWDAAACEIMVTLSAGGTLVLAGDAARRGGEDLATLLREERVQVATLTPSLLAALPDGRLPDLRTVVAVGEPCPPELVARWAVGRTFINGYGPSEATVAVAVGRCLPGEPVTVGPPLPYVQVRIVDGVGGWVPAGQPGELLVGGAGVARGYVTAAPDGYLGKGPLVTLGERFVERDGGRWYRTGDRVLQRTDGRLVCLGRIDDQVKVRGHRVELAEVEQSLRRHPRVRSCAVTAAGGRLVAYVVPELPLSAGEVLAAAAQWLPEFMLPHEVHLVDALPLTSNGKLDRQALAVLEVTGEPAQPARADDVLAVTLALVRQALESDQVGPHDDVFDAGGHSLVGAQIAVALTERFGVPVAALQVYDHPTAAELAELITKLRPARQAA